MTDRGQFSQSIAYRRAMNNPVATAPGLELITTQVIGTAVSSVQVTSCFSATYDVYRVIVGGNGTSSADADLQLRIGSLTSGYNGGQFSTDFNSAGTVNGRSFISDSSFRFAGFCSATRFIFNVDIINPFLAQRTFVSAFTNFQFTANGFGMMGGEQSTASSSTGFDIRPSSGTITGGTIRVYGYKN